MAAYYLLFVLGWQWILRGLGIRIRYVLALQSEMASMLAKYVPGAFWTPLARILWLRRAGMHRNEVVIGSIGLEAGLSAISGVLVFAFGLLTVDASAVVLIPLGLFAAARGRLHPSAASTRGCTGRIFERFGTSEVPDAALPDDDRASRLLLVNLARRRRRAAFPRPLARRGPRLVDRALPGRSRGRGRDRLRAHVIGPIGPRRARGLDDWRCSSR